MLHIYESLFRADIGEEPMASEFHSWRDLESVDFLWLFLLLLSAVWPFISAYRNKTPMALAMVLSLLLVHFVHFALDILEGSYFEFDPPRFLGLIPALSDDPSNLHRFVTSAWLHGDFLHVLSNILVIALAGVTLEQRLGTSRWLAVYSLGFLGGNIAWILTHPDSTSTVIGASGAAFGILGAYMACWPEDKILFPIILIRPWPIWVIAFIYTGFEVASIYSIRTGTAGETNIAHMAHFGGFLLSYLLARPIAKGAPSELGVPGSNSQASSLADDLRKQTTARMGDLHNDPWESAGKSLEGRAARILNRLREEGDEVETRRAWLEELAENTICPVCDGEIITIDDRGVCRLNCSLSPGHIRWP